MDNLRNRLTFDLGKLNKIFYYSQKEDPKVSRIAEFGGEMLYNTENMGLLNLQILYLFVLRAEKVTIFVAILAKKW